MRATQEDQSVPPPSTGFRVARQLQLIVLRCQIEAKYKDDPSGTFFNHLSFLIRSPFDRSSNISSHISIRPGQASLLMYYRRSGLTLTQSWTTANTLDTKIEVDNQLAKGLKAELLTHYLPKNNTYGAKTNLYFKQPNFHGRAFFDLFRGPTATIDAVMGHEGFLVGAEAGYDVEKAAITRYSAAVGYSVPQYTAAITATNNLSVFAASYYHKVNSDVEAGAKATWDSKAGDKVGLEVASKYRLDPTSFVKVGSSICWGLAVVSMLTVKQGKVNDRGIAALAYNVLLRPGFTLGLGASFDTQNLNEASHKVCHAPGPWISRLTILGRSQLHIRRMI